jgi:tetratricopeptide (TPR) repeat protein
MGGVGKTQLALAYAERYRQEYQLGWWVPAETELGVLTALGKLGVALGLPAELPPTELAARARDALANRSRWLLVFDNAPDPAAVAGFLPAAGGGHVLVTSRDAAWQGIADPVAVDLLPADDAVRLLLQRSGDQDAQVAARLVEALGRLPLAVEQAAAYTTQQRLGLARYLGLFEQRRADLLARGQPLAYRGSLDATFALALDELRARNPAAVVLVELCALLAPDALPLALLLSQPALLPQPLDASAGDELARAELVGSLYQTGLLTPDAGETARMHRLVQAVTVAHLPDAERTRRIGVAVELLAGLFPYSGDEPADWPRSALLLAHAQAVLEHARGVRLVIPALATLLERTGNYLWGRGLPRLAKQLHEEALAMRQRLYQGDHPDVARSLRNLGGALLVLGEHERTLERYEQAAAMQQRLAERS